ncbi:MAG: sugar transferase, partial [bacterium]
MLKKYSKLFVLLLAIFDAFIIGLSFLLAYYLRFHSNIFEIPNIHPFNFYFEFFILVIPLWIILLTSFELYKPRRTSSIFVDAKPIFWANTLGILILCSISFFYRAHSYSRLTFVLFGGVNFILLLSSHCFIRGFLKSLRKKGFNKRRILIVGAGELGLRVAKTFQNHASYGYKVIGFLDDDHSNGMYEEYGFEILGRISSLRNCLKARDIDKVVITLPIKAYEKIYHIVAICEYEGIETDIVPDLFQVVQPVTKVINLDGLPIVSVRRTPVDSWQYKFLKRIFDIAFALLVLVITLPLTLLIAIAIKLSTPGPIFFKQERIGKNRRPF